MARSVRMTPEQFYAKWARNLKGATSYIQDGVNAVTEAPGKKAAEKSAKWHSAISSQETLAKWERRVGSVSLEDWKTAMLTKGVGRISAGVDNAEAKSVDFATKLISHQNALLPTIDSMPDLTLGDSIERSRAWIEGMAKFVR